MILKADRIAELLDNKTGSSDPLAITPQPNLDKLRNSGSASVDMRLGTWFVTLRQSRSALLRVSHRDTSVLNSDVDAPGESRLTKKYYVPFGESYILHPGCFVLGGTMEWIRFPKNLAGYVVGKSSWGRRGLIIATAIGVHPGFSGCLTLEITNLGEMPIEIKPGMRICQLFLHGIDDTGSDRVDQSTFQCKRRPTLGSVEPDDIARKLAESKI